MDKIAAYEEMILDSVFEKEASRAIDRYAKKISDIENKTGLTYHGDDNMIWRRKASQYNNYYSKLIKDSKKMGHTIADDVRKARYWKRLGGFPYEGNTGYSLATQKWGPRGPLLEAHKKENALRMIEKQKRKDIVKNYPEFSGIAHRFSLERE